MFKRVAILGAGLLGGSVAISVMEKLRGVDVALWARDEGLVDEALGRGVDFVSCELGEVVRGADLVILATPVGVMSGLVRDVLDLRVGERFLLTDVGSVKRLTHEEIEPLVEGTGVTYVGSHPMAGSEKKGFGAAYAGLLDGAACILTSDDMDGVCGEMDVLASFWCSLGCRIRRLSPEDHDYAVARVSHFPHLVASMVARVGLSFEDIGELAGGGLKDTTRVAAGDPELWAEILLENRDALQRSLSESIGELRVLQDVLRGNDEGGMLDYLREAKRRRDLI